MGLNKKGFLAAITIGVAVFVYFSISDKNTDEIIISANPGLFENIAPDKPDNIENELAAVFVGGQVCSECHSEQRSLWSGSHHDWAMREANDNSVLGNFDNVRFEHKDSVFNFIKRDEQFIVNTAGPDGNLRDYKVKYTFGVEPLQQYLLEFPQGRLQALTVAWDNREIEEGGQRWFHLMPDESTEWGDALHWSGRAYNWNNRCAECHSTNLEKNYGLSSDTYQTSWSEINVSCEACHGPGSNHVDWASLAENVKSAEKSDKGLVVDYKNKESDYEIETCARCHSRRHPVASHDSHGKSFLNNYMPATLEPGLYFPDGQIQDEVYVYGSFLQSKMYMQGVRCTDCHDPHSNKLKAEGNQVCTQCHQQQPPVQRFGVLQGKNYDSEAHHFHKQGSKGALCVNCHMPETTYMLIDPRRDHSFKIPHPELSEQLGTPSACKNCHQDKSHKWTVNAIEKIHGARDQTDNAVASIFSKAWQGDVSTISALANLVKDEQTPAIVKASALKLLSGFFPNTEAVSTTIDALKNDKALVRASAVSELGVIPEQYQFTLISPLLDDPVRAVRIEAARILAAVPSETFADKARIFETALEEYRTLQNSLADTPEAHVNLGVMYAAQKLPGQAETEYLQAITLAPEFIPARINLANLYNTMKRNGDAEKQLREAIKIMPEEGELYYSLGLLMAEEKKMEEVLVLLEKATQLMPNRARVAYNYGLTLQSLGKHQKAESIYIKTLTISPQDSDLLYALVTLYAQQEKWQLALPFAQQLSDILNGQSGSAELLENIRRQITGN
jgi:predicted CXXCH cytochrome family protein